jgi:isoleucyl-tRNA synthetase
MDAAGFLAEGRTCANCGGSAFRKERDILDVWFDSGCSHYAVLRTRPELSWPASLYLEGHDQHRGWFQSSLLVGVGIAGGAPYREVITHGFVVDEKGRKMSKSLGNVISPLDVIKQHGADIFRMWVAMTDYRDPDIALGNEIISRIAEAYRKIRNTARFLLANLSDFDPATDAVPLEKMGDLDRWALAAANVKFARCRKAYEEYEFHTVYHRMLELCTVDLSAIYLDVLKDTLYVEAPDSRKRRSAQTAIHAILKGLTTTLAPIIPYTADEIYEVIPGRTESSVHLASFPEDAFALSDDALRAWNRIFTLREAVSKVLEQARGTGQIGQSLEADVILTSETPLASLAGGLDVDLAKIFIVSHVDFEQRAPDGDDVADIEGAGRVGIRMQRARGGKCARCWNYLEEVAGERQICDRCEGVVSTLTTVA